MSKQTKTIETFVKGLMLHKIKSALALLFLVADHQLYRYNHFINKKTVVVPSVPDFWMLFYFLLQLSTTFTKNTCNSQLTVPF